jgi:hypothetical protein
MRNVPSPAIGRSLRSRTLRSQLTQLKHVRAFLLLCGLASCTGSPATLALQPDFDVMTPTGAASVSIREAPAGMTDEQFTQLVRVGMAQAAHGGVIAGGVEPPFPAQRVVWHVDPSPQRGVSRLVVNAFDGPTPYAYEEDTISDSSPTAVVAAAIDSMSARLWADVTAREQAPSQAALRPGEVTAPRSLRPA